MANIKNVILGVTTLLTQPGMGPGLPFEVSLPSNKTNMKERKYRSGPGDQQTFWTNGKHLECYVRSDNTFNSAWHGPWSSI